jgi:hypothetical protein
MQRKARSYDEAALKEAVLDLFSGAGMYVRQEVPCSAGRADVVTRNLVIELKAYLSRRSLFQAVGQVNLYRHCLNPMARAVVVCIKSKVRALHDVARGAGVDVLEWADVKRDRGVLIGNPPWI